MQNVSRYTWYDWLGLCDLSLLLVHHQYVRAFHEQTTVIEPRDILIGITGIQTDHHCSPTPLSRIVGSAADFQCAQQGRPRGGIWGRHFPYIAGPPQTPKLRWIKKMPRTAHRFPTPKTGGIGQKAHGGPVLFRPARARVFVLAGWYPVYTGAFGNR